MIHPHDLRIANILLCDGHIAFVSGFSYVQPDVAFQVNYWYDENGETITGGTYDIEGIPLTPELLTEWCGMERLDFGGEDSFSFGQFLIQAKDDEYSIFAVIHAKGTLKYLHQLQNVFYAHTGTELQIKIPQ